MLITPSSAGERTSTRQRSTCFSGSAFLLPGSRIENKQQTHVHLVKQHFLPNDEQTSDRKQAIVKAILDPALFSAPAELASKLTTSSPQEAADYDKLVDDLDKRELSPAVMAAFAAAGQTMSSKANIGRQGKGQRWTVVGTVTNPGGTFWVEYEITPQAVPDGVALMSSARVLVTRAAENYPFQLFFRQGEDDLFTGKVMADGKPFHLAVYFDGKGADADNKQRFDAVVGLFNIRYSRRYRRSAEAFQRRFGHHAASAAKYCAASALSIGPYLVDRRNPFLRGEAGVSRGSRWQSGERTDRVHGRAVNRAQPGAGHDDVRPRP